MEYLSIQNLYKQFDGFSALDGITCSIPENSVAALIGPNGAGKTTLIRCILHIIRPTSGTISFEGVPLTEPVVNASFGYLPENFSPLPHLTCGEFLSMFYPRKEIPAILDVVNLAEKIHVKTRTLSRGMIQRLGLAVILHERIRVLLLDEPFLGLDLPGQMEMLSLIKKVKSHGKAVIISSHTLHHIQKIADWILILDKGKLMHSGALDMFMKERGSPSLEEAFLKQLKPCKDISPS